MLKDKTLVFAGAHPDDETFGMGATLAKYAAAGVKVYYICSTRGEAGSAEAEYLRGYADVAAMRCGELSAAAKVLGLAGVMYLGYRDSGMPGTPDNNHPDSLLQAPLEQVTFRLVKLFRELKPDVVITHDPSGGYQHPDHIATHNAVVQAFSDAGKPGSFPTAGPPFQPAKLYFGVRSHRLMKLMVRLMPLFGQNPHKFGRNGDIDLARMVSIEYPIHARVRLTQKARDTRTKAAACHASQGGGRPPSRGRGMFGLVNSFFNLTNRLFGYHDYFMRAYPPPDPKHRESDLFAGL